MISIRRLLSLAFLACLFTGCAAPPGNTNTSVVQTTPSPAASASPATTSATASVQVTLPLLDALLTDEKFVGQLRQELKLSDEQIASLKRTSGAEIARLQETNAEDTDGNATNARTRASEELSKILGDAKAKQVATLANDYWSKGDTSDAAATGNNKTVEMLKGPNAVPTDTRVVVNIPAFRMDLFQDGTLLKSYKVGIGYPEFPLPFGLRKAQTIIFNPTWTPPDSPWVEKMKNVTAGETVKAGDKDNPLGPIKIPIGLPSLIHGGKSPAKIGKFASHGCVGLTNAQVKDFAALLAKASNTSDVSDITIASYLEDREKTKTVKLSQMVPVELRYETIVLEDGKLHLYKDVYAQDSNTEENLRAVLEANGVRLEDIPEKQRTEILNALKDVKKETVIDISSVAQKGYPAPVDLDTGTADKRGSKPRIKK
jgi:lipoprotein-anchoring transpeptidase ErfK/SrfK